jgi:xylulokinase
MITIGIDLGTSAVKVLAVDAAGTVLHSATRDYPLYMHADHSEQDPADWWEATAVCLRQVTAALEADEIAAISFSGQMHGLVLLDEDDNILRRAILWNDQRTTAQCEYLNETIGRDTLLQNAANIALTGFTAPKILWVRDNQPEIFARIAKIMLPKDYIAYKLSGVFSTDLSDASGMLLLDVQSQCWSDKMLDICGITRTQLPQLFKSYEAVGTVTPAASEATGLPLSAKIVAGGGDQAVGAVGCGIVDTGMCSVSLGTSGVLFVAADSFAVDTSPAAIHSFCHATGRYHFMGVTLAAAGSMKWWMEEILKSGDYAAEQAQITAPTDILFLPYLSGERTPINDPHARGAFIGMSMTTTRAEMTAAVMQGVAMSLRDVLTRVRGMGCTVDTARIIGGGAKSSLWCQMMADILQLKVERVQSEEGPAYGAAILAMVGAGCFPTVEAACAALIKVSDTFTPCPTAASIYDKHYSIYTSLYPALKEVFHEFRRA